MVFCTYPSLRVNSFWNRTVEEVEEVEEEVMYSGVPGSNLDSEI